MPSTDRRLELKAKDIDGSDRLTAGCVLIDLASPGVSQTSVYAKKSGESPPPPPKKLSTAQEINCRRISM